MILVDSDILIAHLRGLPTARDWLVKARRQTGALAISVVSVTELTGGMGASEKREVWRLVDSFVVEDISEIAARRAGEFMRRYRRSHTSIGLGDYLIAGTADTRGLELATLNVRHFPMLGRLTAPFRLPRP